MDCIEFNKNISLYLDHRLDTEELNEFLHHLEGCEKCTEELEVNFIVQEGIRLLDSDAACYDLTEAFKQNTRDSWRKLAAEKIIRRIAYVVMSLDFWAVIGAALVCGRLLPGG